MNKKTITIAVTFLIIGIVVFKVYAGSLKSDPSLDTFAQCLSEKQVVMYGAYWCPHCQQQKKLFGQSFRYIKYVECTNDIKLCQEKNIVGYPTWIFSDGSRIEGETSFAKLAVKSACVAP